MSSFWRIALAMIILGTSLGVVTHYARAQQRSSYEGKVREVTTVPIPAPNLTRDERRRAINRMQPQYIRWAFTGWQPIRLGMDLWCALAGDNAAELVAALMNRGETQPQLLAAAKNLENDDGAIPAHAWGPLQDAIAKCEEIDQ